MSDLNTFFWALRECSPREKVSVKDGELFLQTEDGQRAKLFTNYRGMECPRVWLILDDNGVLVHPHRWGRLA